MPDSQAFRAARVVLDIGMHLELEIPRGAGMHEGETWTPDIGLEFVRGHTPMDDALRRDEIDRSSSSTAIKKFRGPVCPSLP